MRRPSVFLAVISVVLALPAIAGAATLVPLAPSTAWDSTPIHAASPPGDPRVFVVERGGRVRIVENGVLKETPFLTVPNVDTEGERGMLSIAFPSDYAASGLFYLFTVAEGPDALDTGGIDGDLRVVEYRRSASNPDLADPASARLVLKQSHSSDPHHNGGQIAFGPDGYLYITMGDAANGSNAQTLSNDLGKVLRIDPREQAGGAPFGVPPSNPFVGTGGAQPEIYALGLRNPYRASFAPNGDLVLPDVGQSTWEEVNLGRATGTLAATTLAGANLGWPTCEGLCTSPHPEFVDPVFQYGHGPTPAETTGDAIIGGYVVRDATLTGLTGRYLYGDLGRAELRTLDLNIPGVDPRPAGLSIPAGGGALLSFGEDGRGCIYVMTTETAYRVAPSATPEAACPPPAASSTPPKNSASSADTTPPELSLSGAHRQPLRHFILVFATCNEACSLRAGAGLALPGARSSSAARPLVRPAEPGEHVGLHIKLTDAAYGRIKRAVKRGLKAITRVGVTATDRSGNSSQGSIRIRLSSPRP